jgi:hypothetical protein
VVEVARTPRVLERRVAGGGGAAEGRGVGFPWSDAMLRAPELRRERAVILV